MTWFGSWLSVVRIRGSAWFVLPTALPLVRSSLRSLWLVCPVELSLRWPLDFTSSFGIHSLPLSIPILLPPLDLHHPTGFWPICMNANGLLISAIRTAIASLRAIASSLEAAINGAEAVSGPSGEPAAPSLDLEASFLSSSAGAPSQGFSASRSSSHDEVAQLITSAPPACHQLCISIGATPEERAARVQRAWEAGHWARATLEGRISKPRPTPKVANRPTTYIVLRAPGLAHPVRVSTAAEYFKILPRFSEESVSHAFPSLSEARVYCIAAGVDFPELQER